MTKKPFRFSAALIGLSLCLCVVLILGGCGNKKTESQSNQTQTENNQENDSSKEKYPYSFIPEFEEQVIYDKDGIKLTAEYDPDGANPAFNCKRIMYCKIENNRKEKVHLIASYIETGDGFRLLASLSCMPEIEPGEEDKVVVVFYPAALLDRGSDDALFQEYGLGSVLGDFRLNFMILDADTHHHIIEDSSDYIKTEKGDISYDYSRILNKQPVIDQDGVKIYCLDHYILPPVEEGVNYRTTSYYTMLLYYENQNEEEYSFVFDSPRINGKTIGRVWHSSSYDAKSKGFDIIIVDADTLKENGFESFESLEFDLEVSEVTYNDEKRHFEEICTKNVLLKLSEDWKIMELGK